jgi:hypothetical protein
MEEDFVAMRRWIIFKINEILCLRVIDFEREIFLSQYEWLQGDEEMSLVNIFRVLFQVASEIVGRGGRSKNIFL